MPRRSRHMAVQQPHAIMDRELETANAKALYLGCEGHKDGLAAMLLSRWVNEASFLILKDALAVAHALEYSWLSVPLDLAAAWSVNVIHAFQQ